MKFLTTTINRPHSMYMVRDAPCEVRRKVVCIPAICAAVVVAGILHCVRQRLRNIQISISSQIQQTAEAVTSPILPRTIAI